MLLYFNDYVYNDKKSIVIDLDHDYKMCNHDCSHDYLKMFMQKLIQSY